MLNICCRIDSNTTLLSSSPTELQFQKISIPTQWKISGNSKGVGEGLKQQCEVTINFQGG